MIDVQVTGNEEIMLDFTTRPQVVSKALVRAMNRGIKSGRTHMTRELAADLGLKQKDVRDKILLQEATLSHPLARLAASRKKIPLMAFGARGPVPSYGKGRGVTYRLKTGAGRIPNAFIATVKAGDTGLHTGVFVRTTKKRLPIKERFGPSLGHVFAKYREGGVKATLDAFAKNFKHELKFAQSEGGAGADTE